MIEASCVEDLRLASIDDVERIAELPFDVQTDSDHVKDASDWAGFIEDDDKEVVIFETAADKIGAATVITRHFASNSGFTGNIAAFASERNADFDYDVAALICHIGLDAGMKGMNLIVSDDNDYLPEAGYFGFSQTNLAEMRQSSEDLAKLEKPTIPGYVQKAGRAEDAEVVMDGLIGLAAHEANILGVEVDMSAFQLVTEDWRSILSMPIQESLLLTKIGRINGAFAGLAVVFANDTDLDEDFFYVDSLFVAPEHRNRPEERIGKQIMSDLGRLAQASDVEAVRWFVSPHNVDAKMAYKAMGAEYTGRTPLYANREVMFALASQI